MAKNFGKTATIMSVANKLQQDDVPVLLDISLLEEHPDNEFLFGELSEDDVKNLADGIRENGFIGAIDVWKLSNGHYRIFSGHRRKRAMVMNGETKIKCFVYPLPEEETMQKRMLLGGNIFSRGALKGCKNPTYAGRQIQYLKDVLKEEGYQGSIRDRLAEEFGVTGSMIQRYESFLNCIPEVVAAHVEEGWLQFRCACMASTLADDKQLLFIEAAKKLMEEQGADELNAKEVEAIIKKIKNDTQLQKAEEVLSKVDELAEKIENKTQNEVDVTIVENDTIEDDKLDEDEQLPGQEEFSDPKSFEQYNEEIQKQTQSPVSTQNVADSEDDADDKGFLNVIDGVGFVDYDKQDKVINKYVSSCNKLESFITERYPFEGEGRGTVVQKLKYLYKLIGDEIERLGEDDE